MPPARSRRSLPLAALLALTGCGEPSYLFGGPVHERADETSRRGGAVIINGGTSTGAWAEEDTTAAQQPSGSAPEGSASGAGELPSSGEQPPSPVADEQPAGNATPSPAPVAEPAPDPACGDAFEDEVLALVNAIRAQHGKAALRCEPAAGAVADAFSGSMCEEDFFSHVAPDGSTPVSRLADAGVTYIGMGENIAAGQDTPTKVVSDWMDSPGHRANILGDYTHLGVGYRACATPHYHYWTQSFIRR